MGGSDLKKMCIPTVCCKLSEIYRFLYNTAIVVYSMGKLRETLIKVETHLNCSSLIS